jgi:hypothetical protein
MHTKKQRVETVQESIENLITSTGQLERAKYALELSTWIADEVSAGRMYPTKAVKQILDRMARM